MVKKKLPIVTFHATFKNGKRLNKEAVPSGLSIYDLDHIPNPRERWAPPSENDTKAYIDTVLKLTGLGGKENLLPPVNRKGVWKLSRMLAAMTVVECGILPEEVDVKAIKEGYRLAFKCSYPQKEEQTETEEEKIWDEYWDWSPEAFGE